jgi:hypothetical protein
VSLNRLSSPVLPLTSSTTILEIFPVTIPTPASGDRTNQSSSFCREAIRDWYLVQSTQGSLPGVAPGSTHRSGNPWGATASLHGPSSKVLWSSPRTSSPSSRRFWFPSCRCHPRVIPSHFRGFKCAQFPSRTGRYAPCRHAWAVAGAGKAAVSAGRGPVGGPRRPGLVCRAQGRPSNRMARCLPVEQYDPVNSRALLEPGSAKVGGSR